MAQLMLLHVASAIKKGLAVTVLNLLFVFRVPHNAKDCPETHSAKQESPITLAQCKGRGARRQRLLAADPHCAYCNREVTRRTSSLEHVVPRSRGGYNTQENVILACCDCNTDKSNSTIAEWAEIIRVRLAALSSIHWRDRCHENTLRMDHLQRILNRLETMLEGNAERYEPVPAASVSVVPTHARIRKGEPIKRHHFGTAHRRYAIISRETGDCILFDISLGEAVEYLSGENVTPGAVRLLGYQEMFHPELKLPDWRQNGQHSGERIALQSNSETDCPVENLQHA